MKNKRWVLIPGHLHMFFADQHSLGKVIDGSGLDTVAIESGIYSAARMRSISDGKRYTEVMEPHTMFALAIYSLKLEGVLGREFPQDLQAQARSFRDALYEEIPDMIDIYEDLANHFSENIKPDMLSFDEGLPKFLNNYLEQVETFLACVSAIHHRDLEACLTLMDRKIKYYSATDQPWYFKLMTIHLGEMNELKKSDPATWERLKESFVVTKSTMAFCNLFTDQGLEQEIKKLKRYGSLPGITQDEEAVDRFLVTSPQLTNYVESFLKGFPKASDADHQPLYHQLQGNMGLRCALNSVRIRDIIVSYCQGNPFVVSTALKNITSGVIIPKAAADDILNYPAKGQARYEEFIETRLRPESTVSVWDPLPQLNLKRFATWMKSKSVKVGDKIIKLKEDRKLLSKIIIVAKARPDLINRMEDIVGNYEMSVIPRANFSPDGTMLLTADKSSLMNLIVQQKPKQVEVAAPGENTEVLIVDAMPEVKSLKKKPTCTRLSHIKEAFNHRIKLKAKGRNHSEIYVAFDEWREKESLKYQCRTNRALGQPSISDKDEGYDMHDGMSLKQISMADLISTSRRKTQLAKYLANGLLETYSGNLAVKLIVTEGGRIFVNKPHTLPERFTSHDHEEADQQIPMLMLYSLTESPHKHFDVYSPDTDVLIELIDLTSRGFAKHANIIMHAGKSHAPKTIDVVDRVRCLGHEKSLAMVGLHTLTGEDHGNKFVGITKSTWCKMFFGDLQSDDPIVEALGNLGSLTTDQCTMTENDFPTHLKPLEKFICMGYDKSGPFTIPELRWKLWSRKEKEAENLPPTRQTLAPLFQRTNRVGSVYKSYTQTHPALPELSSTGGWTRDAITNTFLPVYCLAPPAPKAVLELVKCGCKTGCERATCSCFKNNIPCTTLCQCSEACTNHQ